MSKPYPYQHGIALIQVLLITAILTILALYLTQTAKDQVKMAQWSNDKAQALVELHSAESQLLFSLITEFKSPFQNTLAQPQSEQIQASNISQQWNFFDQPFMFNQQVEISIQDQAGLLNIHFPDQERLKAFFISQGASSPQANVIVDSLLDWQDLDNVPRANGMEVYDDNNAENTNGIRNGVVPDKHDFSTLNGLTPALYQALLQNSTIHRRGPYSPVNSPAALLSAISSNDMAQQVIVLRDSGQLNKNKFTELTDIKEDDNIYFYTSNVLAITLTSKIGESRAQKKIVVQLMPYATADQQPISILSNRG
jgi:general secretion pathway protein K